VFSDSTKKEPITFLVFVRQSVCINAIPTGRISLKFGIGAFIKICRQNPSLVKIGKTVWH
jgi:hypothetical protein